MTTRRAYIDGPFGQLHVRMATPVGTPERVPILCLPSNPNSSRIFDRLLPLLGRDRRALAVDTPGFGGSDPPSERPSIPDYAAAFAAVTDALGLPTVDLLGCLTGSRIAVALAEARPALVRRLVLISAPVYSPSESQARQKGYQVPTPSRDGSHFVEGWAEMLRNWPAEAPLEEISDLLCDRMLRVGGPQRRWIIEANAHYRYEDHLGALEQPILVLNPPGPLHETTARIAAYLRHGQVKDLPWEAHGTLMSHAPELAGLLREFLDA